VEVSNENPILGSLDFTRSQSREYRLSHVFVSNGTEYSGAAVMSIHVTGCRTDAEFLPTTHPPARVLFHPVVLHTRQFE
jgi:hypothetical protein